MSEGTRRVFLSTSGLGVAALGAAALAPTVAEKVASSTGATPGALDLSGVAGSLVAFVGDVRAGEVSLMVGEQEIVVHDEELVARLLRAAAR